ncbi:MAG: SPOR domain-containing protein [Burkholderiaceae bacterium]|jgi:DedD protein|nr:SPOR domain-containing protein [Burkholderiaceae bacterium]
MGRFSLFKQRKPEAANPDSAYADGGGFTSGGAGGKKPGVPPDADDPMLPEKKKARRRLVGAITITLAAVIVIPMIFDSEPQTVSQDILIDIPSRDKPSRTLSRETARKKTEDKTVAAVSADKPSGDSSTAAPAQKAAASKPAESAAKDTGKADGAKADTKSAAKSDAKQEKSPPAKTATAKQTDAAKQADPIGQLIAQQSVKKDETEKQGKYVVQVAAVSTQDKARELQNKLQNAGLSSYTQKVSLKDGGERIRIRVGPMSDRKELNSTCAKLSKLKLPCTLVN